MNALKHTSFPELASRLSALYNEQEDALLLGMLGQEYVVRREGVFLHGQRAPENHTAVILDYLASSGNEPQLLPWRSFGDFAGAPAPEFRKRAELPLVQYVPAIISRSAAVLPLIDGRQDRSIVASDLAFTVRALPKVYLHVELSREAQDFPSEAWMLFSWNADAFLSPPGLQGIAELLKDRLLSTARIY